MSATIVFEGPDGRLYEIPAADAARFAVPAERVAELRRRQSVPDGHLRPGDPLPPHVPPPPAHGSLAGLPSASHHSTTIPLPHGGTVVLNFFFGTPHPHDEAAIGMAPTPNSGVEGYHLVPDAHGIPSNHTETLWGDYLDKHGNPAVGWHSHDPVTGNAM